MIECDSRRCRLDCALFARDQSVLDQMGFEAWGEVMVKDAPDEGIKRLKTKLASDIADLVEEDVRDQIPKAIARALRVRNSAFSRGVSW